MSNGHRGYQGNRSRYGQQDRGGPRHNRESELLPGSYLSGGYFDDHGNLRSEFVSADPVEKLVKSMANAIPPLVNHQLRRFFGHCRAIETRLKTKVSDWGRERTEFLKLHHAATYAVGAQGGEKQKIPHLFRDFIERNVDAVKSEKDFRQGFMPHFEALVGFGAAHIKTGRS